MNPWLNTNQNIFQVTHSLKNGNGFKGPLNDVTQFMSYPIVVILLVQLDFVVVTARGHQVFVGMPDNLKSENLEKYFIIEIEAFKTI